MLDNGHLLDQVLKRSAILQRIVHKELGIISRKKCCLAFAESGHPTVRARTPLSRGILKSKGHGKLSIHFAADELTIGTIFALPFLSVGSVFTEQLQTCVKNLNSIKMDREILRF